MTNSEDPDQTAPHCFVSPICPYNYIFMVYDTLKIMHNILREKYFDIVGED